jgi:hypothetical protein
LRFVLAFAGSATTGWALGWLLFDRSDAWPYVAALLAAGLILPFSSGERRPRHKTGGFGGRWTASR